MPFIIADTFTASLAKLPGDAQKAAKTTAYDLQMGERTPSMQMHRLEKAKDKRFWSVRVDADIRIILHQDAESAMLCYVDRHDPAYAWAERRKLETHPATGAAQMVELCETVREVVVPVYVAAPDAPAARLPLQPLAGVSAEELLRHGVPSEWIGPVREATEDTILTIAGRLPAEAAEAVLALATGCAPPQPSDPSPTGDPFEHPDARRRFRIMTNREELEQALDQPWEKWTIFLHPEQRALVEREFRGPARVTGSAGTGKTIVALHRAAHLARANPDARILLATFSETLANSLRAKLRLLLAQEPRAQERIETHALDAMGLRLYARQIGPGVIATREELAAMIGSAARAQGGHAFTGHFLMQEWECVVDAHQLETWEAYRDVDRLGRRIRLREPQRQILWSIYSRVIDDLRAAGRVTFAGVFTALARRMHEKSLAAYDFAVIDEAQDLSIAQIRFLAALAAGRPDALFLAGDPGQRIFQQPFSWLKLGVDIRGRSTTLKVNYRTSHQIRQTADLLLDPRTTDADANVVDRRGTVSVFNGAPPDLRQLADEDEETAAVSAWLAGRVSAGDLPHEIGVFVRSESQIERAVRAAGAAKLAYRVLDEHVAPARGAVSVSTMHLAKGLEFRSVVAMACDDEVIPLQARIEAVGDDGDLRDVYETERQLLYVACTRARDHLLVTGVEPASEFLDDMGA